jgi:galactitol-specific phosphotransferase system IIB component
VIFISRDLGEQIKDRAKVPVIIIENFMNTKEVETKLLDYFKTLQ